MNKTYNKLTPEERQNLLHGSITGLSFLATVTFIKNRVSYGIMLAASFGCLGGALFSYGLSLAKEKTKDR